jgi:hypothetical protein
MSDETQGYPGAPPDWYPDPAGGPGKRWWDGYAWTEGIVLPTAPPAAPVGTLPGYSAPGYGAPGYGAPGYPPYTGGNPSALLDDELRFARRGAVAVFIIAFYQLWSYVYLRAESVLYRSIGHQYHRLITASDNHRPAPHLTFVHPAVNPAISAFGGILILVTIVAVVQACIWQYRAASTARALGYPAKHSPGWGVGSWFVPIVSLWMPYQAIRDCLAPGDPNRRIVRLFWICFIGQAIFALAAGTAALASTSLSLVFTVPGVVACLGIMSTGPRFVSAIATAHRGALARPA